MKTWRQLESSAGRIDTELRTAHGTTAELCDDGDGSPLVTVTIGAGIAPTDRDRVLRAVLSAAVAEIRRQGA